jgi:adenosylmethionine-8-amino-7-oxononanoate aminotransferase
LAQLAELSIRKILKHQTSSDWIARSLRSVWHPCTQMQHHEEVPLIAVSHGQGAVAVRPRGQALPRRHQLVVGQPVRPRQPAHQRALKDQLDRLEHAMLAGFTHEPVIELSEQLAALTGHALGHAFYASDGASAVEIAMKMSFHAWRNGGFGDKQEFVCLQGSYHGETIGALAVTDVPLFKDAYGPLLRAAHVVASPDARNASKANPRRTWRAAPIKDVEQLFAERGDKIAAIIVEPLVQCATGMAMHDPLYLELVRELCDRHHVHLIADEIAVGCGRTGTFFACEQAASGRTSCACRKGISGGYLPLSLVLTHRRHLPVLLQRRHHARLPAFAFLHRQCAGLPRGAGDPADLPRRRRVEPQPRAGRPTDRSRWRRWPSTSA